MRIHEVADTCQHLSGLFAVLEIHESSPAFVNWTCEWSSLELRLAHFIT